MPNRKSLLKFVPIAKPHGKGAMMTLKMLLVVTVIALSVLANNSSLVAWATSRTYDFTVTIPNEAFNGPLAGASGTGSFTFDESLIPATGFGSVTGSALFTDFSFFWNGISYDETTANATSLGFGGVPFLLPELFGQLTSFVFGNHCHDPQAPGTCFVISNTNDWRATQAVSVDPDSHVVTIASTFFYAFPGAPGQFGVGRTSSQPNGPVQIALRATPIPEPPAYTLLLVGVALLAVLASRHKIFGT